MENEKENAHCGGGRQSPGNNRVSTALLNFRRIGSILEVEPMANILRRCYRLNLVTLTAVRLLAQSSSSKPL